MNIGTIPSDELRLVKHERKNECLKPSLPLKYKEQADSAYIHEFGRFFTESYVSMITKPASYPPVIAPDSKHVFPRTTKPSDESRTNISSMFPDAANADICSPDDVTADTLRTNAKHLSTLSAPQREPVLVTARTQDPPNIVEALCYRQPQTAGEPFRREGGTSFLFHVAGIRVPGAAEPLWATLVVYDVKSGQRLTEEFSVSLNGEEDRALVSEAAPGTRTALFSIMEPSAAVYLIVKVFRIVQRDDTTVTMMSSSKTSAEKVAKHKAKLGTHYARLKDIRQPILWGAVPVFSQPRRSVDSGPVFDLPGAREVELLRPRSTHNVSDGAVVELVMEHARTGKIPGSRSTAAALQMVGAVLQVPSSAITEVKSGSPRPKPSPKAYHNRFAAKGQVRPTPLKPMSSAPEDDRTVTVVPQRRISSDLIPLRDVPVTLKTASSADPVISATLPEVFQLNGVDAGSLPDLAGETIKVCDSLTTDGWPAQRYKEVMFLRPLTVDMTRVRAASCRNVVAKFELFATDSFDADPLPLFLPREGTTGYRTACYTTADYHTKERVFADEIKLQIPFPCTAGHHVRVTFFHVKVKEGGDDPLVPIGYAALPLMAGGEERLVESDAFRLRVAGIEAEGYLQHLAPSTSDVPRPAADGLGLHASGDAIFSLSVRSVSTLHTSSPALSGLFSLFDRLHGPAAFAQRRAIERESIAVMRAVCGSSDPELVESMPVILNVLWRMMLIYRNHQTPDGPALATEAFIAALHVLAAVDDATHAAHTLERSPIIDGYVTAVFHTPPDGLPIQDAIMDAWTAVLTPDPKAPARPRARMLAVQYSWVITDLIVKGLRLDLAARMDGVPDLNASRAGWYPEETYQKLDRLIRALVTTYRGQAKTKGPDKGALGLTDQKFVARTTALFVHDLLWTCDPREVFPLIDAAVSRDPKADKESGAADDCAFEFLRVVFSHSLLTQLSNPMPLVLGRTVIAKTPLTLRNAVDLLDKEQFLPGLLTRELRSGLTSSAASHTRRLGAASLLVEVLQRIDVMYGNDRGAATMKAATADLYLPALITIITHYGDAFGAEDKDAEIREHILLAGLWLLTNISQPIVLGCIEQMSTGQLQTLTRILSDAGEVFSYSRRQAIEKTDKVTGTANVKSELEMYHKKLQKGRGTIRGTVRGSATLRRQTAGHRTSLTLHHTLSAGTLRPPPTDTPPEALAGEVALTVMHVAALTVTALAPHLNGPHPSAAIAIRMVVAVARSELSDVAVRLLPALVQQLVSAASATLFRATNSEFSRELVDAGLKLLTSSGADHRRAAVEVLYVVTRANYLETGHVNRTKFQLITDLAKMCTRDPDQTADARPVDSDRMVASLEALGAHAAADTAVKNHATYAATMKALSGTLAATVRDLAAINEQTRQDPEAEVDARLRIADGYLLVPAQRLNWLASLGDQYVQGGWHAEAAIVALYIATLKAEMLGLPAPPSLMGGGGEAVSFGEAVRRCLVPVVPGMPVQTLEPDADASSDALAPTTVVTELVEAAGHFTTAKMSEHSHTVLMVAAQVSAHFKEYGLLASCHAALLPAAEAIRDAALLHGERPIGTFYRVAFYGALFDEDVGTDAGIDGKEFVYREAGLCRLPEIKNRLYSFWHDILGSKLVLVTEGTGMDGVTRDPEKAYLQLTSLQPFSGEVDGTTVPKPANAFDAKTNIRHFYYENPYVESGKLSAATPATLGSVQTVLETADSLPGIRKRALVVRKSTIRIDPLQTSIDTLARQSAKLTVEATRDPPNVDSLQIVAAGSVRVQVNAGPAETARCFLANPDAVPDPRLDDLRARLLGLVETAAAALKVGKTVVPEDRQPFHVECVKGLRQLVGDLREYIEVPEPEWADIDIDVNEGV